MQVRRKRVAGPSKAARMKPTLVARRKQEERDDGNTETKVDVTKQLEVWQTHRRSHCAV